jgi:FkbM family methyltransferase
MPARRVRQADQWEAGSPACDICPVDHSRRNHQNLMSVKLRYLYRAYRYRLRVDPAELRFVCSQLHSGQVAADIGCHKGAYTYWMRRRVGPYGAVFAFEPQPKQVDYLRSAFSAMRYDNVAIVPLAVSNTCGQLPLHIPNGAGKTHAAKLETRCHPDGTRQGVHSGLNSALDAPSSTLHAACSMLVDITTLDAFFDTQDRGPDFLKIDVEGHELAVLEGARRTIESNRPTLLIECEARHRTDGDVRPVFDLLYSHGYEGSFFLNGQRRPLADFDPNTHQRIDEGTNSVPRGYVNNFAFVPAVA